MKKHYSFLAADQIKKMLISVDIQCIRSHVAILQEEQRQARFLEEYLIAWYTQAVSNGTVEVDLIKKHLQIVRNQISYIQQRVEYLEDIAERFAMLEHDISECLEEALHDACSALISS